MNTEANTEKLPGWLRLWLAVGSAWLAYRVWRVALTLLFLGIETNHLPCPVAVIVFLHRWDQFLVPFSSLTVAVLASRWIERKLADKGRQTGILTAIVLAACVPFDFHQRQMPVMVSPLETAISRNYSIETVEALIDRYPQLVKGSEEPLVEAAYRSNTNLVKLLIRKGADVDGAIQRAQQLNSEGTVKLILDCSAEFRNTNQTNATNGAASGH